MDALRADVVIGASQKGLMLPPGLGFVAVNERARAMAESNPTPRFYWDWGRRRERCRTASSAARRRSTCCTACRLRCN